MKNTARYLLSIRCKNLRFVMELNTIILELMHDVLLCGPVWCFQNATTELLLRSIGHKTILKHVSCFIGTA